ncbi:MAG: hypothetical protein LWX70_05330 [Sphingobacteriia bacterium]|nr:hypothetical protein [Sphingobacteriia bacterium]
MRFLNTLFLLPDVAESNRELVDDTSEMVSYRLTINTDHDVFKGHFPDKPVVPGVCTISLVRELLEKWSGYTLLLKSIQQCKFTGMIIPDGNYIDLSIKVKNQNSLYAEVVQSGQIVFKMKATWVKV